VTGNEPDPVAGNNADTEDTDVLAPPPPPPNNPPVATDDSGTTAADTPVAIGVTANDSDPDGNLDPSTVQVTTGPANGTVSCAANGVCTFTPIAGFSGTDSFTYEICDAAGACDTASVTITVAAPQAPAPTPTPTPNPSPTPTPTAEVPVVPPPPSLNAVDDSAETSPNTAIVIEVELNDEIPSRNAVRLIDNTEARDGSVECTARGVCTYSPGESNTSDVFDYTICIEGNPCDSARVRIRVLRPGAVESATAAEAIDGTLPFTGQPIAALLLLMLFSLTLGSSLLYASRPRTPVAPAMARVERGPATGVWTFAFPPSE
jgi:hypothetical protein